MTYRFKARVTLHDADAATAEKIQQVTNLKSLSDVISILIGRYGNAFLDWWVSNLHHQDKES